MSDLHGCLPIEIGIVSEHAAEHGDVDGSIETSQHLIGLNVACFAFEHALGQRDGSFTFFGPDEGELRCPRNGRLALGPAGITLRLIDLGNFAENSGDCAREIDLNRVNRGDMMNDDADRTVVRGRHRRTPLRV